MTSKKYPSIVCVLVIFIAATNAQSHSLFFGSCNADNGSDLLYQEVINIKNEHPKKWYSSFSNLFSGSTVTKASVNTTFVFPPDGIQNFRSICGIQAIDKATDGHGAHPKIVGGGLGQTWTSIYFKSQSGRGILFTVSIYAAKQSAPPLGPAPVPAQVGIPPPQHPPQQPPPGQYHPFNPPPHHNYRNY